MEKTFFISDTHFCHSNIIDYCNRPFQSVKEMNEKMIKNWNSTVKDTDRIFCLGDFCLGSKKQISDFIARLNGKKILLLGNHDHYKENFYLEAGFVFVSRYPIIYNDFILSHVPLPFAIKNNLFNIHGHIHQKNELSFEKGINISVENIGYKPVLFKDIDEWRKNYERKNGEISNFSK